MEYIKQNFADGQTLKADHLNYIEDGIYNLSTNGGGGVISYNDLEDVPCKTVTTRFIGFENKTVEIAETVREGSGYMYYIGLIEGDLGELGSTTGDGIDDTCDFNVDQGDRVVIVCDGVEYKSEVGRFANYLWLGKAELTCYNDDMPGYMTGENIPLGICCTENGFIIGTEASYVGTHEISLYVYKDTVIPLEEKYIPETIKRTNDAVELFPIDIQSGQEYKIPAGSTLATLTPYFNFGVDSLSKATNGFVYIAVGEYIIQDQDVESGKWTAKSVQLDCSIDKTIYYNSYNNRYMGTGVVNITIPEPLDYDVNIALYSNPQIIVYAGKGGSM